MDHTFIASQIDNTKCAKCKRGIVDHTPFATCEVCPSMGEMELLADMLMCKDCIKKEMDAAIAYQAPELQEKRLTESKSALNIESLVDKARTLDFAIKVRTDVYNAETVDTYSVFKSIEDDPTVQNKQFAKASFLNDRYEQYATAIFDYQEKMVELQNKQRVIQQEMNKLANTLREDERNKLRMLNPDYKPGAVKTPSKPRSSKPKPRFDKAEVIKQAELLQKEGFPVTWSAIQSICTQRDMTPLQAAGVVRTMMGR